MLARTEPRLRVILAFAIFASLAIAVLAAYFVYGVGWDYVAHFMGAEALLTPNFFSAIKSIGPATSINYGIIATGTFYFEVYRAPLSTVVMAVLLLFLGSHALLAYLVLMVLLLVLASAIFSKSFGIDVLLVSAILIMPYLVDFPFMVNSEEMLSLALIIITLALMMEKKWQAGITLALACLSKYTVLILFFLPIAMWDRKRVLYAYLGFFATMLPWFIFNYYAFGNPAYSFLSSLRVAVESTSPSTISSFAMTAIFVNFIPAATVLAYLLLRKKGPTIKLILKDNLPKYALLISFFVLAVLEFVMLSFHESDFDQARYGYILYASVALLLAATIGLAYPKRAKFNNLPKYALCLVSIVSLIYVSILVSQGVLGANASRNIVFPESVQAVNHLNLSNCSFVSNDWVYLRYYGIMAYSPYDYNSTSIDYPAIVFRNVGVNSSVVNVTGMEEVARQDNFSIYIRPGYAC